MSQRRQWIIDRRLQGRFIIVLLLIGAVNCIFYIFTLNYLLTEMHHLYQSAAGAVSGSAASVPFMVQKGLFAKAAISGLIIQGLLIALLGVYFSNRISGPIYRLNKAFLDMSRGEEAAPIILRKHDFMTEIIENYNTTIAFQNNQRRQLLEKLLALKGQASAAQLSQIDELIRLVKPGAN